MADIQKTIEIVFGAVDRTGNTLTSLSSNISRVNNELQSIAAPIASITTTLVTAETAVIAFGAALLGVAVNDAAQFSQAVSEIGTLVNATPAEVDALKASIQDFAATSASSFDAINQATYVTVSNIGNTSAALDILAVAEKGAVVGATDLETSASLLSRTMNAYGAVTQDSATNTANAERIMAALFATVQNGDTNMAALSAAMGKVASVAASADIPIESLGAAIAAITASGVSTEETMTRLVALFKELLNPSQDLKQALGGLDVTTDGLQAVMTKLKETTGGTSQNLFKVFSSAEAAQAAIVLANDAAGKFEGTLNQMPQAAANFQQNYQLMVQNVGVATQQLLNQLTIVSQLIGDQVGDTWADALKALSLITQGFTVAFNAGTFDPIFDAINQFGQQAVSLLTQIGQNLPAALAQVDFSGLLASFQGLGGSLSSIFDGFDVSTPEGLAEAIQKLVDAFTTLTNFTSGVVQAWQPVIKTFFDLGDEMNKAGSENQKLLGNIGGGSQILTSFKGLIDAGTSALNLLGIALGALAAKSVVSTFTKLAADLGLMATAAGTAGGAATGLGAILTTTGTLAVTAAGAIGYTAGQGLSGALDYLLQKATGTTLGGLIADVRDLVVESGKGEVEVKKLGNSFTGIDTNASQAAQAFRDFDAEVAAVAQSSKDFTTELGRVEQIATGVGSAGGKLIGVFNDLASAEAAADAAFLSGKGAAISFRDGLYEVEQAEIKVVEHTDRIIARYTDYEAAQQRAAAETKGLSTATVDLVNGYYVVIKSQKDLTSAIEDTSKSNVKGSAEWKRVQDAMLAAKTQADDTKVKLLEIAARKYEIDVSAAVDLKVAQIEAQTARIQAAFQATSAAIQSLSDTVSSLYQTFANTNDDPSKEQALQQAARRAEERLDKELKLKERLTDAIIRQANAASQRLNSNQPLIEVDGGQLTPELEMIFDKILNYTQIRASNEGLNLLLGVGP